MFDQWSADDPVSPWEKQREVRNFDHAFVHNPFVQGVTADPTGACSWE
jgi:deoxyribonuclease-1